MSSAAILYLAIIVIVKSNDSEGHFMLDARGGHFVFSDAGGSRSR